MLVKQRPQKQMTSREKIPTAYITDEELIYQIYKELLKMEEIKDQKSYRKMNTRPKQAITKRDTKMAPE